MERCRTTSEVYGFEVVLKQAIIFLSSENQIQQDERKKR
jgi:hypothetical protein